METAPSAHCATFLSIDRATAECVRQSGLGWQRVRRSASVSPSLALRAARVKGTIDYVSASLPLSGGQGFEALLDGTGAPESMAHASHLD
jgi:hypothetical protein